MPSTYSQLQHPTSERKVAITISLTRFFSNAMKLVYTNDQHLPYENYIPELCSPSESKLDFFMWVSSDTSHRINCTEIGTKSYHFISFPFYNKYFICCVKVTVSHKSLCLFKVSHLQHRSISILVKNLSKKNFANLLLCSCNYTDQFLNHSQSFSSPSLLSVLPK
jgi:hypothetical protein